MEKKYKMTVYSEVKIDKPQKHYQELLEESQDLFNILEYLEHFGEQLRVFLRLYKKRKYDGACKVVIRCFRVSYLYSMYELYRLYMILVSVSGEIDNLLWRELEEEVKEKGMLLI